MAQIRRVVPSTPQLAFQNVPSQSGAGFEAMADLANAAYKMVEPKAIEQIQKEGTDAARAIAQQQIGDPAAPIAATNGGGSSIGDSLARTESGGNYQIENKEGYFGKYQWGKARLDDYNRANGTTVTKAEFLANPGIQEQAQRWAEKDIMSNLNDLVGRSVNGQVMTPAALIAVAHLGGTGGARRYVESNGEYDPDDSNGTHLSDYARIHGGAGNMVPPTMIRDADGALLARLHSPMSEPFRQAYMAAAGTAYHADMQMKGMTDLMGISQQFMLDPQGYTQAATAYVDELVSKAPAIFQEDLRGSLTNEVQRRSLGILEAQQSDIRQRAENSTTALAEKQSADYAAAVASGDPREINAAHAALTATLKAKEALPGAAWTPEQSANVFTAAEDQGKRTAAAKDTIAAQRAENAANAIQARQASELTAAVASGDPAKIKAATDALNVTLGNKEVANGSTWTKEQSDNVRLAAQAAGQQAAKAAADDWSRETKSKLDAMTKAGEAGLVSTDAGLLSDPKVRAQFPNEVAGATAAQQFALTMPDMMKLPPSVLAAAAADKRAKGVQSPDQIAVIEKMEKASGTMAKDYADDPVAAAIKYRSDNLPPALPDAAMLISDPDAAKAMMKARADYMAGLRSQGYTASGAILSGAESDQYGAMFAKEVPPEARLAAATLIVEGFGDQAGAVFRSFKGADPTTQAAAEFMANGDSPATARDAVMGQAMLEQGLSKGKFPAVDFAQVDPGMAQALANLPTQAIRDKVMSVAAGYFAYNNRDGFGANDGAKQTAAAKKALNAALGASWDQDGNQTGGVQDINGQPAYLPAGVRGPDVAKAMTVGGDDGWIADDANKNAINWQRSGIGASKGSVPMMGKVPLTINQIKQTRLVPEPRMGETVYRLEYAPTGQPVRDKTGGLYVFDLNELVKGGTLSGGAGTAPGGGGAGDDTLAMPAPYDPATNQPRQNADGSVSTEITTSVEVDGQQMLIPTIWWDANGKPVEVPVDQAFDYAMRYEQQTGKKFPRFGTVAEADAYAEKRSAGGGAEKTPLAK